MKAIVISDTHSCHRRFQVPEADVLIHCGDISAHGTKGELIDFNVWLGDQPVKHAVVIAGNHDHDIRKLGPEKAQRILSNAHYLQDSSITIEGIKFYGSPWTPDFFPQHWVFNQPRRSETTIQRWAAIPDDAEVLITHGPPHKILDVCPDIDPPFHPVNVGCYDLRQRIKQLPLLRWHFFGHVHEARGTLEMDGVRFVNAASLNRRYEMYSRQPWTEVYLREDPQSEDE